MLSLDFHAHIEPSIDPVSLENLGACVVAVTRSLNEFAQVADRLDRSVTWAVGVHPSVPASQRGFSPDRFRRLVENAPVVGEIGLDKRSSVDLANQRSTLEAIFTVLSDYPRVLNVHSAGATADLLDVLEAHRPIGVVLHWWRGTLAETSRALELDCSFSINSAEVVRPRILEVLPRERVLTETDHPFGDRHQTGGRRPGRVGIVENALARQWSVDIDSVRRQVWRNMRCIVDSTGTAALFPRVFQASMLAS